MSTFGGLQAVQPKKLGEDGIVKFDFTSALAAGETISSATVTASVYSGTDAAPGNLIAGADTISGAIVSQLIAGSAGAGVLGVIYELLCTADTSLGKRLQIASYMAIVPDLI